MIIECNNCNKKFEINSELIPEKGRLLECSSCNNHWFFKKEETIREIPSVFDEKKTTVQNNLINESTIDEPLDKSNKDVSEPELKDIVPKNLSEPKLKDIVPKNLDLKKSQNKITKSNNTTRFNFLNLILIIIISIIALIVFVDTLKSPISKLIPNIEFILYNLYETIKDIILFFKDLL